MIVLLRHSGSSSDGLLYIHLGFASISSCYDDLPAPLLPGHVRHSSDITSNFSWMSRLSTLVYISLYLELQCT